MSIACAAREGVALPGGSDGSPSAPVRQLTNKTLLRQPQKEKAARRFAEIQNLKHEARKKNTAHPIYLLFVFRALDFGFLSTTR
jgi:hypothetical protein